VNSQGEATQYVRLDVAAGLVHLPPARIRLYVRQGIVRPSRVEGRAMLFGEPELARLRKIRRLTHDLGLNTAGVEIVMRLWRIWIDYAARSRIGQPRRAAVPAITLIDAGGRHGVQHEQTY